MSHVVTPSTPAESVSSPPPDRASLAFVYATVFLDLLGFGIILPFLPFFARDLGASGLGLGVLFASYSGAQLLGAAWLGRVSDRLGRRPVLLISLLGSALSMAGSAVAGTLFALCAARALAGLFGGSIATAQAYVADVTRPDERPRYMGFLGAAIGTGFVFGPTLGVVLLSMGYGFAGAAWMAAILAGINLVLAAVRLRESRPSADQRQHRPGRGSWWRAMRRPDQGQVLAASFLTMFGFVTMETTFAFLGADKFGLGTGQFGMVLAYAGLIIIIVQGGLIGRLSRRFGVRKIAIAGAVSIGAGLTALPFGATLPLALVALGLLAFGHGLATPSLSTLLSVTSSEEEQGTVLGAGQSMGAAARFLGPLIAGALYDVAHAGPYLTAGALALIAAGLLTTVRTQT